MGVDEGLPRSRALGSDLTRARTVPSAQEIIGQTLVQWMDAQFPAHRLCQGN